MQLPAAAANTEEFKRTATRGMRAAIRLGYATRGLVYGLVGFLALLWALHQSSGKITDGHGAVDRVGAQPWGLPLLWAIAIGLACYTAWNVFRAIFDPEQKGRDHKGVAKRIGYFVSAISQGFLATYAFQLASGAGSGGDNKNSLGTLISLPGGRIAVGIAGLSVIGFGLFEVWRGFKGEVSTEYHGGVPPQHRTLIMRVARIGVAARGLVFPLIGSSLVAAALATDASRAHGFGEALHVIATEAYGRALLGVVAAGLVAYGAHMAFVARYARFPTDVS